MTYNQVIKRIKEISLAHRQVRNFYRGLATDFLTDKTTLYPSILIEERTGAAISTTKNATSFPLRLLIVDLVNVSENAVENEQDVISDMASIAVDMIAQFSNSLYTDWRVGTESPIEFWYNNENDSLGGIMLDVTISVPFTKDKCQIPTIGMPVMIDQESKEIYDMEYIATGNEGTTLTISAFAGKKIILLVRESLTQYQVSNNPNSTEFIWDGTNITLGLATNADERFLILYRNY